MMFLFLFSSRYETSFVNEVKMSDMTMRPNATTGSKGKTYRFYTGAVNWPFGYGLSYSTFSTQWHNDQPRAASIPATTLLSTGVAVSVEVANTGQTVAQKIIQLYISTPDVLGTPQRSLVAIEKVELQPGASTTVALTTNMIPTTCAFCLYDDAGKASVPVGTKFVLDVGDGAAAAFGGISVTAT